MKKPIYLTALAAVALVLMVAIVQAAATPESVATGGKLYDAWWEVAPGAKEPTTDHPLWAT